MDSLNEKLSNREEVLENLKEIRNLLSGGEKTLQRINQLIKDIERNGALEGIGNPEALKGDLQGEFSRRIDEKNRLVYHIENGRIYIATCRGHYGDK